ncbi:RNA polymerase sigma factor [Actinoallomurus iriomotensis]|uniref:DNA-directed RNA polymerase sigma-70 factor n=1 Tax=Actinoallomurus iriomotensis TaxID=478107 RepID=A0A9W6SDW9_9ACTN|nr:RNA polymerase sigma factor [Actinoallomurus iriomotensis]GLY90880.1 DNA-directed RNA polymerase sigma-70 factor [Actinoallomurus iriomotensis]
MRAGPRTTPTAAEPGLPQAAFTALYDEHFYDIYRYVAGRLGREVADDIAADTFLVALRRRDSFDASRGGVRPWLFGIATNLVADHRRKETRRYRALGRLRRDEVAESHEGQVVDWVTAQSLQPRLAGAIAALSPGDRDVLLLNALGELSHEEIAQALGIPYGTVGSRLSRARKKVRSALKEDGNG